MYEDTYEVIGATYSSETHSSRTFGTSFRQHTSAYVRIRQHTSAYVKTFGTSFSQHLRASVTFCILSMTVCAPYICTSKTGKASKLRTSFRNKKVCSSAAFCILSISVRIRSAMSARRRRGYMWSGTCIRQHTSELSAGRRRGYTWSCTCICQHTSAYVSSVCEEAARIYVVRHLHLRVVA
jgi:hypothetical protein